MYSYNLNCVPVFLLLINYVLINERIATSMLFQFALDTIKCTPSWALCTSSGYKNLRLTQIGKIIMVYFSQRLNNS